MDVDTFQIPGFEVGKQIAQGGSSTIYRARQIDTGRNLALKILNAELCQDRSFSRRFMAETCLLPKIRQRHIVRVYDAGRVAGRLYLAMEFLPGGDLNALLNQGVSQETALVVVKQIASALEMVHSKGIIHRDVKPDNIMFRHDGTAVLTDFGIAKALSGGLNLTQKGATVGTPKYMSPEQVQGLTLSVSTDIYSLGVVFFALLAGHLPFDGKDAVSIAYKHIYDPIPSLPAAVVQFQGIIDVMLAKSVDERFANCVELLAALERIELQQHSEQSLGDMANTEVARYVADGYLSAVDPFAEPLTGRPAHRADNLSGQAVLAKHVGQQVKNTHGKSKPHRGVGPHAHKEKAASVFKRPFLLVLGVGIALVILATGWWRFTQS